MANPEHLEILLQGAETWNSWRSVYPHFCPELSQIHLQAAALEGVNLRQASLHLANLYGADLEGANLEGANLKKANLNRANLSGANLSGAGLEGANLEKSILNGTDLQKANLEKGNLKEALLQRANLEGAYLREANLERADLRGVRFEKAIATRTMFESSTLHLAKGLEQIEHSGPSYIGIDTLAKGGYKLPDAFLRGMGFKDWEVLNFRLRDPNLRQDEVIDITYRIADMRTQSPIQTNSIFLSYAREDSDFVDAIAKRLDEDRVRYWRDRHDISVGPIEGQIERAINLNGTVLLVLSKNSIHSEWVEFEVRKAREKQRELQKERGKQVHVLCPVALDDSWESCPWPQRLRQDIMEYHVLDCSDWEEESFDAKYEKLRTNLGIYYFDQDKE